MHARLIVVAVMMVLSSASCGRGAERGPAAGEDRRPDILRRMGAPDAFVLTVDEVRGSIVRYESWTYHEAGTRLDFADGELLWSVRLDVLPDSSLLPLQYDPQMFRMLASPEEVRAALPGVELTRVDLADPAIPAGQFLAGDQLLLGFVDGKLVYAESFAAAPVKP